MRDHKIRIKYYLNGQKQEHAVSAGITVIDMLHQYHRLSGTKKGCKEGDCGACTVAIGEWIENRFVYQSVTSCIYPAVKLHGKHLMTIEGLAENNTLHIIQEQIVNNHGAQCGYCSPGVIMSFFSLFAMNPNANKDEIALALEGNICRCTGYEGIQKAGRALSEKLKNQTEEKPSPIIPLYARQIEEKLRSKSTPSLDTDSINNTTDIIENRINDPSPVGAYHMPDTLEDLFLLMNTLDSRVIIAGGTDLYVGINSGRTRADNLIDISLIEGLSEIYVDKNIIRIGSQAKISKIMEHEDILAVYPEFKSVGEQVASRQIRNSATLGGNIANASSIADFTIFLLALKASLELRSSEGTRTVALADFFTGYKQTVLGSNEIISAIEIPVRKNMFVSFKKSSKRKAVDIATVNSCLGVEFEGKKIVSSILSFGGIAPVPVVISNSSLSEAMVGDKEKILEYSDSVSNSFQMISDIRGSIGYRKLLIRNHIIEHLENLTGSIKGA